MRVFSKFTDRDNRVVGGEEPPLIFRNTPCRGRDFSDDDEAPQGNRDWSLGGYGEGNSRGKCNIGVVRSNDSKGAISAKRSLDTHREKDEGGLRASHSSWKESKSRMY